MSYYWDLLEQIKNCDDVRELNSIGFGIDSSRLIGSEYSRIIDALNNRKREITGSILGDPNEMSDEELAAYCRGEY